MIMMPPSWMERERVVPSFVKRYWKEIMFIAGTSDVCVRYL